VAFREVTMLEVIEVVPDVAEPRSRKEIARQLGVDMKTVRRYVKAAEEFGPNPQELLSILKRDSLQITGNHSGKFLKCGFCSSTQRPTWRSRRANVSPSAALRRWPMCAALLGLMQVCSTMVFGRVPRCGSGDAPRVLRHRAEELSPRQAGVQIAAASYFPARDARDACQPGSQFLRNLPRARASGAYSCQLEADGRSRLAHLEARWPLRSNADFDRVAVTDQSLSASRMRFSTAWYTPLLA